MGVVGCNHIVEFVGVCGHVVFGTYGHENGAAWALSAPYGVRVEGGEGEGHKSVERLLPDGGGTNDTGERLQRFGVINGASVKEHL